MHNGKLITCFLETYACVDINMGQRVTNLCTSEYGDMYVQSQTWASGHNVATFLQTRVKRYTFITGTHFLISTFVLQVTNPGY